MNFAAALAFTSPSCSNSARTRPRGDRSRSCQASDLVPEVNRERERRTGSVHFPSFAAGSGLLAALRLVGGH